MKKTAIATLVAASLASAPAFAGVAEELAAMKARIAQLEAQLAEQQATMAKQETVTASGGFAENVSVGGEVKLVANHIDEADGNTKSDIELDTFELGIEAAINKNVTLSSLIEYDADSEKLDVTEAFAVISAPDSNLSLTVGKATLPFLVGNSSAHTDPLTYDNFDVKEGLAMVSWAATEALAVDAYVFNGADDSGDSIDNFGLNLTVAAAEGLELGAAYLSDVADQENLPAGDAWRLNGLYETGPFAFSAEFIEVNADDSNKDPNFLHLGADYATNVFGAEGLVYLGYSETDDGENITDLAEERIAVGVQRAFGENANVVAEFVREETYTDEETDTLNLVLVTEF